MTRTLRLKKGAFRESYHHNRKETMEDLQEGIRLGEYRLGQGTSLADVFEAMFENDFEETARSGKGFQALEGADALTQSDFKIALSQFMLHEANAGWNQPGLIGDSLCTPRPATTKDGLPPEKSMYWPIPSDNDDDTYAKKDGDNYKAIGMPTAYVEFLGPKPYGARIAVDRAVALLDKTGGQLMEGVRNQSLGLRIRREKQQLSKVLGVTGNWRLGAYDASITTYTPFQTTGNWINSYGNTLTDWNSFKTVWLKLMAITDPITGQVLPPPNVLDVVVPPALFPLAQQIVKSTSVGVVDNSTGTATVRFYGPNPVSDLPFTINVHTNQWVYLTTSSNTTWFAGDFRAANKNCQLWTWETMERGQESPRYFEADILYEQRFGYCELVNSYMPFRVTKNT